MAERFVGGCADVRAVELCLRGSDAQQGSRDGSHAGRDDADDDACLDSGYAVDDAALGADDATRDCANAGNAEVAYRSAVPHISMNDMSAPVSREAERFLHALA